MERRQFLAVTGALAALSGCSSDDGRGSERTPDSDSSDTGTPEDSSPSPIPEPEVKRDGLSVGSSTTIGPAEVLVTDALVARKLVGENGEAVSETGLFALIRVETTNTGDQAVTLPPVDTFAALSGSSQFSPHTGFPSPLVEPVSGERYSSYEQSLPDVSRSGWIVFEVPTDFSRLELACSYSLSYEDDSEPVYWTLPVSSSEAPILSLDELTGPDTVEYGEKATFEATISNTGGSKGTFSLDYGIGETYDPLGVSPDTMEVTLSPGETVTKTVTHYPEDLESFAFQIGEKKQTVEVEKAELSWGEAIEPFGVEIQFSDIQINESYRVEGESEVNTHYNGKNYAFVRIHLHNQSDEIQSIPEIELKADYQQFYQENDGTRRDPKLAEPVSGPWADTQLSYESGEELEGWLVYVVDSGVKRIDLSLVLKDLSRTLAEWS